MEYCGREVVVRREPYKRNVSLRIDSQGRIEIKFNYKERYSDEDLFEFIDGNKKFILRMIDKYEHTDLPNFSDGGKVNLFGSEYTVKRSGETKFGIIGDVLTVPQLLTNLLSEKFFGQMLSEYVAPRTKEYAEKFRFGYSYVYVKPTVSAWGTYYGKTKNIMYNTALVFMPKSCIDYVIVHELCHTAHHGHGKDFWDEVERVYPEYKTPRELIKNTNLDWLRERAQLGIRRAYPLPNGD